MLRSFMTTVAFGSLFVGGLAATHLAFAQPAPDGGWGPRGGIMAQADADKDGRISKAELASALDARFARMDFDRDGLLTDKDRAMKRQQRLDERFATLDADRNGQISKAEFTAGHEARAERRADMRGKRGPYMGKGRHHGPGGWMMGRADADKNGSVSKAEFAARATAMFDRADSNKDGFVTADEMKAAREAMRESWKARRAADGRG